MLTHIHTQVCGCYTREYQAMSSSRSTSYKIHESQHLIPACPFNGCRFPVVAERLASLAILVTASDYLQPPEVCAHTHTHTVCADTRSPRRPLPWIYQSQDCKLWSIINSDGVRQRGYREMVKQGAPLTYALYYNWRPWHNFPFTGVLPVLITGPRVCPLA